MITHNTDSIFPNATMCISEVLKSCKGVRTFQANTPQASPFRSNRLRSYCPRGQSIAVMLRMPLNCSFQIPRGTTLPTLPLPTPHEVRSLRTADLAAVPPPNQSTFAIETAASNREVTRYFKKILPRPFKAMGKTGSFHLMYSHSNTLGGCGTDSPTGFDIATAYRAGKANNQKVLYLGEVLCLIHCHAPRSTSLFPS